MVRVRKLHEATRNGKRLDVHHWEEMTLSIMSIDFIKQDEIKTTLSSARWNLFIVDEAQEMSAYAYEGRAVAVQKTKRYQ